LPIYITKRIAAHNFHGGIGEMVVILKKSPPKNRGGMSHEKFTAASVYIFQVDGCTVMIPGKLFLSVTIASTRGLPYR